VPTCCSWVDSPSAGGAGGTVAHVAGGAAPTVLGVSIGVVTSADVVTSTVSGGGSVGGIVASVGRTVSTTSSACGTVCVSSFGAEVWGDVASVSLADVESDAPPLVHAVAVAMITPTTIAATVLVRPWNVTTRPGPRRPEHRPHGAAGCDDLDLIVKP
ncbi:MAG: hypothetical protein WBV89_20820, partial [Ilumatobacter sp.]